MTLGCGAAAGNTTSDNVGPLHLINIKRLAYVVRKPEEAFEMPLDYNAARYPPPSVDRRSDDRPQHRGRRRGAVSGRARHRSSRVAPRRLRPAGSRSCSCRRSGPQPRQRQRLAADVVDRFLARRGNQRADRRRIWLTGPAVPASRRRLRASQPNAAPPAPKPVDFVCEDDVRAAIREKRKIYIGPKTIVTPSARDLAGPSDILVLA